MTIQRRDGHALQLGMFAKDNAHVPLCYAEGLRDDLY